MTLSDIMVVSIGVIIVATMIVLTSLRGIDDLREREEFRREVDEQFNRIATLIYMTRPRG